MSFYCSCNHSSLVLSGNLLFRGFRKTKIDWTGGFCLGKWFFVWWLGFINTNNFQTSFPVPTLFAGISSIIFLRFKIAVFTRFIICSHHNLIQVHHILVWIGRPRSPKVLLFLWRKFTGESDTLNREVCVYLFSIQVKCFTRNHHLIFCLTLLKPSKSFNLCSFNSCRLL